MEILGLAAAVVAVLSALVAVHFAITARIHRRYAAKLRDSAEAFGQMRRDYDAMAERWQEMAAQLRQRAEGGS